MTLTPEELAMMTDEERKGFEEDIDDGEEGEGGEEDEQGEEAGKAKDDDDAGESDDEEEGEQAGRDDGEPPVKSEPEAEPEAETEQQEPQAPVVQPLIRAEIPADMEEQRSKIEKARDDLAEKFEDGDLTAREFQAENRKLDKLDADLDWIVRKAELSAETARHQAETNWYASTAEFLKAHPEISKNELVYNAFDAVVRKVTADKANHNLSNQQQLDKAYAEWADALGIKQEAKPKADAKADANPAPKAKRELPPNLSTVPAAQTNDTDDGKYAALDRLMDTDPLKYEAELAKMSPAESDAYLASQ